MPRLAVELPAALVSESAGVRYLHLDSIWIQGAMRIRDPQYVVLDYVQRMLAALLWLPTDALGEGQAVQLGLGAGAFTRFTAGALGMATRAVEINPQVVEVNRRWFHLPSAAELVIGDAADWLSQADAASVRLLQVDLYDQRGGCAGARRPGLLRRLPPCAGARRRHEREPVRARRELRAQCRTRGGELRR
jgi:spermidine synthase